MLVAFAAIVTTVLVLVIDSGDDGKGPDAKNPPGASEPADRGSGQAPPAANEPSVPSGSADQPGTPSTLSVAWSMPSTKERGAAPTSFGRWITATHVYRGTDKAGLIRYDLATGADSPVELPPGALVCGMTPGTDEGVGGVAWSENEKDCNKLALVDLATGKLRWTVTFSVPSQYDTEKESFAEVGLNNVPMTFSDNALVLGVLSSVSARSRADGAELWTKTSPKVGAYAPTVSAVLADGSDVLAVVRAVLNGTIAGARFNAATGDAVWSNDLPIGPRPNLWPISVNPQVFLAESLDDSYHASNAIVTVDLSGKISNRLPSTGPWGELDVDERGWGEADREPTFALAVDDGVLYGTTEDSQNSRESVVAIDATTGTLKWQVDVPRDTLDFAYVSLAGGDRDFVYAVTGGFGETDPVEVHRWDRSNGGAATVAVLPQPPSGVVGGGMDQVWSGGRLVCTAATNGSGPSITVAAK
ncbi:outer membrane protein assembly factor BamB family protein [Yinghuangia sp. YIM S09857]|uniref:outer membrane protein assembly factor BamB family protein n=1 Tax=Yinghuangia sp. YIM S09857 TaxID=3436929 RepID=UPI003F53E532